MTHSTLSLPDFADEEYSAPSLDMTPLIDCIFQLLVFFMITSTFAKPAVDLTLPSLASEANPVKPEELRISVSADASIYVNSKAVSLEELATELEVVAAETNPTVYFQADAQAPYELFLQIAAKVRQLGITQFHLVHDRES